MKTTLIAGQPSWRFASDKVEAALTRTGGHLGPVRFRLGKRWIEPYSVAPWAEEKPDTIPLLRALRGDFFCAPFGGGAPWRGEDHPPHGESANANWSFRSLEEKEGVLTLRLSLKTTVRPGKVEKAVSLREGESALYIRHCLSGMSGPMSYGHHAMLKFPSTPGSGQISTSPIRYGQVLPVPFEDPAQGGYSSLKTGAKFRQLESVPLATGGRGDLSSFPARPGYDDLALVVHRAADDFAWTCVSFEKEGYLWYSLKDPRQLQSTIFWISNGGRHYAPWNGRHREVIGIEEATSYFHCGLAESAKANPLNAAGFATVARLKASTPLEIAYIMGVAAIPRGFGKVRQVRRGEGEVTFISENGAAVTTPVDTRFLQV